MKKIIMFAAVAGLVLALAPAAAQAQTTAWQGADMGRWHVAGNWTAGVPGTASTAVLDTGNTAVVEFAGQAQNVLIGQGANGKLIVWNTLTVGEKISVGMFEQGELGINSGGTVSADAVAVGNFYGSSGSGYVQDSGSQLTANTLVVGGMGDGDFGASFSGKILSTTTVIGDTATSTGSLNIYYSGTWTNSGSVTVGNSGVGTLDVYWASASIGGTLDIGAQGTFKLEDGTVSTRSFSNTKGGTFDFQYGTLTVDGGTFQDSSPNLVLDGYWWGYEPAVLELKNNVGSSFCKDLVVGDDDRGGSLTISGGTQFSSDNASIARSHFGDQNSTVTVTGAGSTWNTNGSVYVGGSASAAGDTGGLTVASGGHVGVTGTLKVWNTGTVTLNGGSITTQSFDNGSGGAFNFYNGTLTVDGGSSNWGTPNLIINGNTAAALPTLVLNNAAPSGPYGEIRVGDSRKGALTVSGGTDLSSTGNAYVAYAPGATGAVSVNGSGSTWTTGGSLYVGGSSVGAGGAGTLAATGGGSVSVGNALKLWNTGTLTLDGGSITTQSFDNSAAGLFNFYDGTMTVSGGSFHHGSTTLYIDGSTATATPELVLDNATPAVSYTGMRIGNSRQGKLTLSGGTDLHCTGMPYIGFQSSAIGTVEVTGSGTTWTNDSNVYLGVWGTSQGALSISGGGQVTNAGGRMGYTADTQGSVNVDGGGSAWNCTYLDVGEHGSGYLSIGNAGTVSSTSTWVGRYAGASGDVYLTGVGTSWTNSGSLYIGGDTAAVGGTGMVRVYNGAQLDVGGKLKLWDWGNGTLIIDGGIVTAYGFQSAGGSFRFLDGTMTVGGGPLNFAARMLTISGTWTDEKPTLVLDGAVGSTCGELTVGTSYEGTMNIQNGATLTTMGDSLIGRFSGSKGTMTVTGLGTSWTTTGNLHLGGYSGGLGGLGTLNVNSGAVKVNNTLKIWDAGTANLSGGTLSAATIDHTHGGTFNFTGGVLHVGTFQGNLVSNGGRLAPGASPGTTTVTGDYTMSAAGFLAMDLGGLIQGSQYDHLNVNGAMNLDGTLNVALYGGFKPKTGNSFDILDWGSLSGTFGTVNLPGLGAGLGWDQSALYSSGVLSVIGVPFTFYWDSGGGANQSWSTAANWSDDLEPGSADDAFINNGGTAQITGPANDVCRSLTIGETAGTSGTLVILAGGELTTGEAVRVGLAGTGTVIMNAGQLQSQSVTLAELSGAAGGLTVEGGSVLTTDNVYVGGTAGAAGGNASLNVTGGSLLNVADTVKVWNAGTLTLDDGTILTKSFDNSTGGAFDFHHGTLLVNGGDFAQGGSTLNVNGNAATDLPHLMLVNATVSTGYAEMRIGDTRQGKLTIGSGTDLSSTTGCIGYASGSSGTAVVTGAGSTWGVTGSLYVGGSPTAAGGTGALTVSGDGYVAVGDTLKLYGGGTLTLGDGTLAADMVDNSAGGTFNFGGGMLFVEQFIGSLTNTGGTLCPGGSPGILTVTGDYAQTTGVLEIEMGGLTAGTQYDRLVVTGQLALGGALDVVLYDLGGGLFAPQRDDTFDILDWGSLTGQFDAVNLPGLSPGLTWDTSALYVTGELGVVPEPATLALLGLGGLVLIRGRRSRGVAGKRKEARGSLARAPSGARRQGTA